MVCDRIAPGELRDRLRSGGLWVDVVSFSATDSTNRRAADMAEGGAPEGTVVVADEQTEGRGRLGRRWISPPARNLYVSLILRPSITNAEAPCLSLVAGIALADAVEGEGIPGALKWPNDLYLGGRKAGGILAEAASGDGVLRHVVVGVGVNVNLAEDEVPDELRGKATSLRIISGRKVARAELLGRFLDAFARRYGEFLEGGFPALRPAWERRDFLRGRRIRILLPGGEAEGIAQGVDGDGALLFLRDGAGSPERVVSGEIAEFSGMGR